MKILINAISARFGGIATYTRNLASRLEELEVDATIAVSSRFPGHGKNLWHHKASDLSPVPRFFWEQSFWRQTVKRFKPDVLFSSANFGLLDCPVPQVLLVREGGLFDPRYLANCSPEQGPKAAIFREIRRRLIIASARCSDQVVTPTAATRDLLLRWAPDLDQRIMVNPYGTIIDNFSPEPSGSRVWRGDGQLRLLYVSVYYPHKQPGLVCEAVEQLIADGFNAHARITMDISETRDFLGSHLDRLIMERSSERGSITLGRHSYDKLPDLYRSSDIFVFPSISETFGHPMVEALASGLPVIAADTAVNREVCGDAALYFEPLSPSDMVRCIRRLDADPELRSALSAMGRKRVMESFLWESHVDTLLKIFSNIQSRK